MMATNNYGRIAGPNRVCACPNIQLVLAFCGLLFVCRWESWCTVSAASVDYDHRALLIDGQRRFLISGSIHYPRSTPRMWPALIDLAKEGGLDVIQTYVFWNGHEPRRGQYSFEGRYDLVRFLTIVRDAGLYANLRIGPYISAEWNFGGFPEWLREIPGIELRTDNPLFKAEMQRFMAYIVKKMKNHNLFYTQGGPIILSQVENEYGMIDAAYGSAGLRYVQWAASMAYNLSTGVPWTMCKQTDAPPNIIDTCNGFYCDDYTPNSYSKPKVWTENWSGWFHSWGLSLYHRPAEDVAYATARFFQKGGSFMNYYMYHGGTNFGRTSAAGLTTSYDYDAPIDEYGQAREPKWGHLKDLHAAIKLCEPAMAAVDRGPIIWSLPNMSVEISVYSNNVEERPSTQSRRNGLSNGSSITICAAFLSNSGLTDATLVFFGKSYTLPAWSVSILPDCAEVAFNTAQVSTQTSLKHMVPTPVQGLMSQIMPCNASAGTIQESECSVDAESDGDGNSTNVLRSSPRYPQWLSAIDVVGVWSEHGITYRGLLEQINTTHDLTDYLWYTTNVNVPEVSSADYNRTLAGQNGTWLAIETVRDVVYVFVNGEPADGYSFWNGSTFRHPLTLQPGNNSIALLSATVGLWYTGPFYDKEVGGLSGSVVLEGVPNVGHIDLRKAEWIHQVGLMGERLNVGSGVSVGPLNWSDSGAPLPVDKPLVWYKTRVDAPRGNNPVVLDLSSMRKGAAWINGHHLGRFWPNMYNPMHGCRNECDYRGVYEQDKKCFSDCGQQSQSWYHVPREWLRAKNNVLVLFEEIGGNVSGISISTQVVHAVCSHVSESHPPSMKGPKDAPRSKLPELHLDCGTASQIERIEFASFGNPAGNCGEFVTGTCHAPESLDVVQKACEGHQHCFLQVEKTVAGDDPCPHIVKSLAVQAVCRPSISDLH